MSHVYVNGATNSTCYDSGYNRGSSSSQDLVTAGECLLELDANDYVSIVMNEVSSQSVTASLTAGQSWFQMQKIHNPNVIMLREAGGGDTWTTGDLVINWDTVDRVDSIYDFTTGTDNVTVNLPGFYKVTYGIGLFNQDGDRQSALGRIQTNATGVFADSPYGWSHANARSDQATDDHAVSASTIVDLDAGDAVRIVAAQADDDTGPTNRNIVGNQMHFDIEYLGPSANVLRVFDAGGGVDIEPGPVDITWDTINDTRKDFTYTADDPTVTIERTGLYHVAYGVYTDPHTTNARFEFVTSLRVNGADANDDVSIVMNEVSSQSVTPSLTAGQSWFQMRCNIHAS
jgi:hypothetical protein